MQEILHNLDITLVLSAIASGISEQFGISASNLIKL